MLHLTVFQGHPSHWPLHRLQLHHHAKVPTTLQVDMMMVTWRQLLLVSKVLFSRNLFIELYFFLVLQQRRTILTIKKLKRDTKNWWVKLWRLGWCSHQKHLFNCWWIRLSVLWHTGLATVFLCSPDLSSCSYRQSVSFFVFYLCGSMENKKFIELIWVDYVETAETWNARSKNLVLCTLVQH